MRRPAERCSQQGLLLVEAVLASIVMTVGLVLISRGLGGQLQALRRLEDQYRAVADAERQLAEWEALGLFAPKPLAAAIGSSARWSVGEPVSREIAGTPTEIAQPVTLTSGGIRLMTLWPTTWVPDEWPRS